MKAIGGGAGKRRPSERPFLQLWGVAWSAIARCVPMAAKIY
jgi:hypothetical protein